MGLRGRAALPLRLRKIGDGLEYLPAALVALARHGFDVAHAFTPSDALAAIAWARVTRVPAVLTCLEPLARETLAARRLRLVTLARALEHADGVLAADERVASSLWRWAALDAPVLAPDDIEGHVALYRGLSQEGGRRVRAAPCASDVSRRPPTLA